jgi:hypothetical protein
MTQMRSWSTAAGAGQPIVEDLVVISQTEQSDTNANQHAAWERVRATLRWPGVDYATGLYQVLSYRQQRMTQAWVEATAGRRYFQLVYVAQAGLNVIVLKTFAAGVADLFIFAGTPLMIWRAASGNLAIPDRAVYMTTADGWVSTESSWKTTQTDATGMAYDPVSGYIFWARAGTTDKVYRSTLQGATEEIATGLDNPVAIAVDGAAATPKVYWTEGGSANSVKRANLDGSSPETLVSTGISQARGICLYGLHMYVCDNSAGKVYRYLKDGTGKTEVMTGLGSALAITTDSVNGRLFVADPTNSRITGYVVSSGATWHPVTSITSLGDVKYDEGMDALYYISAATIKLFVIETGVSETIDTAPTAYHGIVLAENLFGGRLFRVSEDTGVSTIVVSGMHGANRVRLTVTPVLTAAAEALGADAHVYLMRPMEIGTTRGPSEMREVVLQAEFQTEPTTVAFEAP